MNCNLQSSIITTYYTDYKFFFSKPNVQGIGFGYKYTNGICTCVPCIHIFVSKKISNNCLHSNDLIPTLYKGIKTDVIETGPFAYNCSNSTLNNMLNSSMNIGSHNGPPYTGRVRPIQPSYTMSTIYIHPVFPFSGSFGYIVTDNEQKSKTYCLLSNNSTFANNNEGIIGKEIIQPAYTYGGRPHQDTVAKLLKFYPLKFSSSLPNSIENFNTIDASVASLVNISQSQLINPFIPDLGIPRGINDPSLNLPIKWTGPIIGAQSGSITSIDAIIKVTYPSTKIAWFKDVFIATGEASIVDLGSLICDKDLLALGIVFSCSSSSNIVICKIKNITSLLKITLLTL